MMVPVCLIWVGKRLAKYTSGPSGQPWPEGAALNVFANLAVTGSRDSDTLGKPGLAARTVPPKPSSSDTSPTVAKSVLTACWVSCLLRPPLKASSWPWTTILRPLMPPVELT